VVEPRPGCVGQVNGEKLDDEEVVVRPAHPTCKAVILQSHDGVGFPVKLDIVQCLKMLRETCVTHVAPEQFGPWHLEAELRLSRSLRPPRSGLRARCSECASSSPW
jgi:hypothetical protein